MSVYLLVHGAWHGGWCWRDVKCILEAEGHSVHSPTLTGLGSKAHLMSRGITMERMVGDIVKELMNHDLQDVVLVGHSFAGPVITGAADREPERIRCLIYLDAAILEDGEAMFSSLSPEIVAERRKLAGETSGGVSLPVPPTAAFGILDPQQAEYAAQHLTPHPLSSYETPLRLNSRPGDVAPCSYIKCTDPVYAALEASRQRAYDYGWPIYELKTGHDAMISAPEATAALLTQLGEEARRIY